jgi:hypothetical protein
MRNAACPTGSVGAVGVDVAVMFALEQAANPNSANTASRKILPNLSMNYPVNHYQYTILLLGTDN